MNANGRDLCWMLLLRPYAGESGYALRGHAKIAASTYECFFNLANEINGANTRRESPKIKNGIADKLTGTVKSYVTTAIGFKQLNSLAGEKLPRGDNVLHAGIAAQRDDGRMLQQKQRVTNAAFFYQMNDCLLQFKPGGIIHAAQINDVNNAKHSSILVLAGHLLLVRHVTHVAFRILLKLLLAVDGTEIDGFTVIVMAAGSLSNTDIHLADWINGHGTPLTGLIREQRREIPESKCERQ